MVAGKSVQAREVAAAAATVRIREKALDAMSNQLLIGL